VTLLPSPPPTLLEPLVALSLLRLGTDTSAARTFRERFPAGLPGLADPAGAFEAVCAVLGMASLESRTRFREALEGARRALDAARAQGITVLAAAEAAYPPLLWQIPDPPVVLWARGRLDLLTHPAVAIVGSRLASEAGLATSRHLAREVSRAGLVVTSGLARGIDGAAHRGALDVGGMTIGVLGSGLDVLYPAAHRGLGQAIAGRGLLVSEFPPGTPPFPRHFPLRNRIISGLSLAVVVVEANERSGSLITARAALEQGRDVLAVPGPLADGRHRGCHSLIKDGARLVESVEDILEEIGWARPKASRRAEGDNSKNISQLEDVIRPGEVVTLDVLAARSGLPAPILLAALGRLEVAGRITRMTGGTFARLD
jgi:DNA processing protein